jgi:GNAT superfamily N-acetyltransferase
MVIRRYEERDREAVIGLFRDFMAEMGDFADYVERAIAEELGRVGAYYLAHPRQGFWVAGDVVGMAGVERQSDAVAELRRMVVARDQRRRGIARALLATAEDFCRQAGYATIVLNTSELQQPAMRLYEASGYRRVGTARPEETTHKLVGGLTRHYYEKKLSEPRSSGASLLRSVRACAGPG